MKKIQLPHNWQPRPYQRKLWGYFEHGGKRGIEIAHRRWGKDDVALHLTAVSVMKKPATYWHMLPEYSQARKAIWNAINPHTGIRRIDEAFPQEIRTSTNDHEMFIRFINGGTYQVVGSDSYNSLVGTPPYGLIVSEWSRADPAAWAYLAPILEENGGWALFITTPTGRNHAYTMYNMALQDPAWFAEKQTVDDTGAMSPERIAVVRREYHAIFGIEGGDALIEQEYYCSFSAPILGAIYAKWVDALDKAQRIKPDLYDPSLPVHTGWDLGYDDATAIWWFQVAPGEVRLIDYYETNGSDIQHYAEILAGRRIVIDKRDMTTGRVTDWHFGEELSGHEHRQRYEYGRHYVPHDAAHKLLAAAGRSIVQQAYELGVKMSVIPSTSQQNSIAATRRMLEMTFIDSRCARGIEALRNYKFEWDEDKKTFKSTPLHDWASHGCDAGEIVAQAWRLPPEEPKAELPKFWHEQTANEIFFPTETYKARERI